jgi:hypothetical protein
MHLSDSRSQGTGRQRFDRSVWKPRSEYMAGWPSKGFAQFQLQVEGLQASAQSLAPRYPRLGAGGGQRDLVMCHVRGGVVQGYGDRVDRLFAHAHGGGGLCQGLSTLRIYDGSSEVHRWSMVRQIVYKAQKAGQG